jgi:hypothetical protein
VSRAKKNAQDYGQNRARPRLADHVLAAWAIAVLGWAHGISFEVIEKTVLDCGAAQQFR